MTFPENFNDKQQSMSGSGFDFKSFARGAAERTISRHDQTSDSGVIWSTAGKPISRLGGGRYSLTADFLVIEKGMLSTDRQQIRTHEIFDVDGRQTMSQKARGVGTVTLHAKRSTGDFETIQLIDIPDFRHAVEVINSTAEEARIRLQRRSNSQTLTHEGQQSAAPSAPVGLPKDDLNDELMKVANLHASGILTDEEFAAAKRKLLGL